jgi:hypothetical protein
MGKRDFKHNPDTDFENPDNLSQEEARREVEALREGIEYHDHRYYVENKPEISDAVYDKLFRRLQQLEQTFPDLASENSPTRRIGAEPLEELRRVAPTAPMLSLNAVFEADKRGKRRSDEEIRRDIKNQLWWSPFVDRDRIRVRVADGVATLRGNVRDLAEREAAVENAWKGGAADVRDLLNVASVPSLEASR